MCFIFWDQGTKSNHNKTNQKSTGLYKEEGKLGNKWGWFFWLLAFDKISTMMHIMILIAAILRAIYFTPGIMMELKHWEWMKKWNSHSFWLRRLYDNGMTESEWILVITIWRHLLKWIQILLNRSNYDRKGPEGIQWGWKDPTFRVLPIVLTIMHPTCEYGMASDLPELWPCWPLFTVTLRNFSIIFGLIQQYLDSF